MGLTRQERYVHKAQVRQKKCQVCKHRRELGMSLGEDRMVECSKGLRWPPRGYCREFDLDDEV